MATCCVKLGRFGEAGDELERAATLTKNAREQTLLRERAAAARRAAEGGHTATATVTVAAPRARVWEALTRPELVKQYFFGTQVVTDWKVGGPVLFRGDWEGKTYEDLGTVLSFHEPDQLSFNYWSGFSGLEDKPELRQIIRYDLGDAGGRTRVTVTQSNVDTKARAEHAAKNWQTVLGGMKKLLEQAQSSSQK